MTRLENVPLEDLRTALDAAEGKRETLRLVAAILYKQGPSVPTIANWLDVRAATVYGWFDRLEAEPVETAIRDDPRPGRPPKLASEQVREFEDAVRATPADYGFEATEWTPSIAREFLREEFGVEYTVRHVRRLMADA